MSDKQNQIILSIIELLFNREGKGEGESEREREADGEKVRISD
jgi:hypothetical protein